MTTKPKRTRKAGHRGLQDQTVENLAKLRAALKADPHMSIDAAGASLGWDLRKAQAIFMLIRHDYKKVWVHKDDHPEFWKQNA